MAEKIGEGFYDIYPKINQRAANAARQAIGANLSKSFAQEQRKMEDDAKSTNSRIVSSDNKTAGQRVAADNRVRRNRQTNTRNDTNDQNRFSRLQHQIAQKFQNDQKNNEGVLHKLATQFRTIGTVARGLALGSAVLGSFGALENILGGITAAAPIAAAGIALIPAAIAGAVAEGIILKGAFKGVGTAIGDAFDPKKADAFKKDLQALSPAARSFVQQIAKAKGVLPNIQQTFFSQPSLQQAAGRVRGFFKTISGSFRNLIAANGNLFGRLLGDVTNNVGAKHISSFLNNLARLLRTITPGITALGAGFIAFIDHVSQSINGGGINKFLKDFGAWLTRINTKALFAAATAAFKGFAFVASQVWGTLKGIFKALGGSDKLGARFFQNIGGFFATVNKFVNSGTGQTFLKQLFGVLNVLSDLAASAIGSFLRFLAGAFAALWPSIKPFADKIKQILKDLEPLGPVVGSILAGAFDALTAALTAAEPWIKKVVDYLVNNKEKVKEFADKLLLVVAAYLALKKAIGIAKPVLDLVGALKGMPPQLLLGLAAFALIAAAIIYTYNHSKLFRDVVASVKDNLGKLTSALGLGKGAFKLWGDAVKGIVMGFLIADIILINGLIIGLTATIEGLKRAFDNMKHWILTGWDAVKVFFTTTMPNWFVNLGHNIQAHFDEILANMHAWYSNTVNFFTGTVAGFFTNTIPNYFVTMGHNIAAHFNEIVATIHGWYSNVTNFFTGTVGGFFTNSVPSYFSTMRSSINAQWSAAANDVHTWYSSVVNFFSGTVTNFFTHTVPSWFATMRNAIVAQWNAVAADVHSWYSAVSNFFTGTVANFFTKTVPGWFTTMAHAIEGIFNSLSAAIATWYNHVAGFLTSTIPNFFTKTVPGWFTTFAHAVEGIFNSLSAAIATWYNHVAQFLLSVVPNFFTKTMPAWFHTMYLVVSGKFTALYNSVVRFWTNTYHYFTGHIQGFVTKTVPAWFTSLFNQINTIYNKILSATKGIINNIIHTFTGSWGAVERAFRGIVNAIAKPVQRLIDIVYTKGIKKFWDAVAKPLGNKAMDVIKFINPFASGGGVAVAKSPGLVHGLAGGGAISEAFGGPTQDNVYLRGLKHHPGIAVSGGEFVLKASTTKKLGVRGLTQLNEDPDSIHGLLRGFASGGFFGASGNSVNAIEKFQRAVGPGLRVTSTTGGGHTPTSWHYRGQAVDFAGGKGAMNAAASRLMAFAGAFREMEHMPSWGVKNGKNVGMGFYGKANQAIHWNHVHLAMSQAGAAAALDAKQHGRTIPAGSGGGAGFGLTGILAQIAAMKGQMKAYMQVPVQKLIDASTYNPYIPAGLAASISKFGPGGGRGAEAKGFLAVHKQNATDRNVQATAYLQKKLDAAAAAAAAAMASSFGGSAGAALGNIGSGQVRAWISQASHYANIPASWVAPLIKLINNESGGNPNAINRTDSNARRGDPSIGILQMIRGSFERYRNHALPDNRRNPVAEIAAAINYIRDRYGTIFNTPYYHGHTYYGEGGSVTSPVLVRDHGGPVYPGMNHIWNGTGSSEWINDPTGDSGGDTYVILDGIDVTSRAHVTKSTNAVTASLKRRSKL